MGYGPCLEVPRPKTICTWDESCPQCTPLLLAGEMNDAAEVLRMMYDALIDQGHRDLVTSCFGLDIHESVRCRHCDMETHALRYTQYFQVHFVSAASGYQFCKCVYCGDAA
jgi:hypothetical protein